MDIALDHEVSSLHCPVSFHSSLQTISSERPTVTEHAKARSFMKQKTFQPACVDVATSRRPNRSPLQSTLQKMSVLIIQKCWNDSAFDCRLRRPPKYLLKFRLLLNSIGGRAILTSIHVGKSGWHSLDTTDTRYEWTPSFYRDRNTPWKGCFFQQSINTSNNRISMLLFDYV